MDKAEAVQTLKIRTGLAGMFSYILCFGACLVYSLSGGGIPALILISAGIIVSSLKNHVPIKHVLIGPMVVAVTIAVLATRSVPLIEKGKTPEYLILIADFTASVIISCTLYYLLFREKTSRGLSISNCYQVLTVLIVTAVHPGSLYGPELAGIIILLFFVAEFLVNRQVILDHFHLKKAAGREFVSGVISGSPLLGYLVLAFVSAAVITGGGSLVYSIFRERLDLIKQEGENDVSELVLRKENTHDLRNNQPDINNTRYKMIVRAEYPGNPLQGLYMKGRDYDYYSNRGRWEIKRKPVKVKAPVTGWIELPHFHSRRDTYRKVDQYVRLVLLESTEIFAAEEPGFLEMDGIESCLTYFYGGLSFSDLKTDMAEYRVKSFLSLNAIDHSARLTEAVHESNLYSQFPSHLERVETLGRKITSGSRSVYSKINAIRDYLAEKCVYTTRRQYIDDTEDPVEYFLFISKEGVCVHFASAFVLMARASGLSARYCTGYVKRFPDSGEYSETGDGIPFNKELYLFQKRNAHAWAEVYIPDAGWQTVETVPKSVLADLGRPVDPPAAAGEGPDADQGQAVETVEADAAEDDNFFDRMTAFIDAVPVESFRIWGLCLGLLLLLAAGFLKIPKESIQRFMERTGLKKREITAIPFFNEFLLLLEKKHIRIKQGETASEFAKRLSPLISEEDALFMSEQYSKLRFGGKELEDPVRLRKIISGIEQTA